AVDALRCLFGIRAPVRILFLDPRPVRFEQLAVRFVGAKRFLVGQEEIAGKAVLDLHHVADGAELLDTLKKNDFHFSSSLFHDVGKQADVPGALDRTRQFALLLGGNGGDPRRDDLAALGDKALEQSDVLVIDARRVLARKGAGLAAAKECARHYSTSSSRARKFGRSSRSPREERSLSPRRIIADGPFSCSSTLMVRKRMTSSLMFDWRSSSAIAA